MEIAESNNDLCFIIQARLASSRLPSKICMDFYEGESLFDLLIDKLKSNFSKIPIIIATSVNKENDLLEEKALEKNVFVYRGSEDDVLDRFINAADFYGRKNIIRICSDNPFLNVLELKRLIDFISDSQCRYDYVSFLINGLPSIKTHFGFWAEFVKVNTLKDVCNKTDLSLYHEHVTNYIYSHPEEYSIHFLKTTTLLNNRTDIRMTLDTKEDFDLLKNIYRDIVELYGQFNFTLDDIVKYLDSHSEYTKYMIKQIQQNTK